jgi:hypothetical protein
LGRGLFSALFLFVARVFADHADDILAAHDFARFAEAFDGCSDFHGLVVGFGGDDYFCR